MTLERVRWTTMLVVGWAPAPSPGGGVFGGEPGRLLQSLRKTV